MGRPCTACTHSKRDEIDAACLGSASNRAIGAQFGLSPTAVHRHRQHLPASAIAQLATQKAERGASLASMWLDLRARAERLAREAENAKDGKLELQAVRELTRLCEIGLKAAEQLRAGQGADRPMHEHEDWPTMIGVLLAALNRQPAALADVRNALAPYAGPA